MPLRWCRKELVFAIIVLFIGVSISPTITAESIYSIKEDVRTNEKDITSKQGIIHDRLLVVTYQDLRNVLKIIVLNEPRHWLIGSRITNLNRKTVTIHTNSMLKTKDNEVLWEDYGFQRNVLYCEHTHPVYFNYDEFKQFDYPIGGFELILNIHIPETETNITVVHHGYFIGIFAIIFNPFGERI